MLDGSQVYARLYVLVPRASFPLTSGRKTRNSGTNHFRHAHRCRLRSETGLAEFGYISFLISKWLLPESLVFWPLVKRKKDSGNEIVSEVGRILRIFSFGLGTRAKTRSTHETRRASSRSAPASQVLSKLSPPLFPLCPSTSSCLKLAHPESSAWMQNRDTRVFTRKAASFFNQVRGRYPDGKLRTELL